jgi:hypothetical protein
MEKAVGVLAATGGAPGSGCSVAVVGEDTALLPAGHGVCALDTASGATKVSEERSDFPHGGEL